VRFDEAVAVLDARQPEHMPKPDLDRMRALAALLDDPQLTYPTIHVTGTNGKTTTTRLTAGIACAHGLTTGQFTSPHLVSVVERLEICGEPIAKATFGEEFEHLIPFLRTVDEQVGPVTYFEALAAMAFLVFADAPVQLGVFEVGMGGTWDATNLIAGDVAVICPIGLDHPELGSTIVEVAAEKAGIIKQGKVAVVREQVPEALEVIERRCEEQIATMLLEHREWGVEQRTVAVGGQALVVRGLHATYGDLLLPIHGEHAAHNAAAAIAAVRAALGSITSPGRLEVVSRRPLVILDGAHNPAAAEALAIALPETFAGDRLHLVMAVFTDKDLDGIVRPIAPLADVGYATAVDSVRARPAQEVAAALTAAGVPTESFGSVAEAFAAARKAASEEDLILVTGSLYTVADARRVVVEEP
jgi:dihydrofolate synthase/folylpolyglutamate synthase